MPYLSQHFSRFVHVSCIVQLLAAPAALAGLLYAGPGLAQTTAAPTSDPLRGERRLLPLDDVVVTYFPDNGAVKPRLVVGLSADKFMGAFVTHELASTSNRALGVVAGKMFALPRDTFIVAADDLTLLVGAGQSSNRITEWSVPLPHLLPPPQPGTAVYRPLMAMADFTGDGYDDLVIGSVDKGLQVATAVDVTDPSQGLKWGDFLSPVYTVAGSALATGDFDGDGDPEVALARPNNDEFILEIYHVDPTEVWLRFEHSVTVDTSFAVKQVSITAGDFDHGVSALGLADEEIVVTASAVASGDDKFLIQPFQVFSTLQPVAVGGASYSAGDVVCDDCNNYVSTVAESARLDWTGALEQMVVGINALQTDDLKPASEFWIVTFDGSDQLKQDVVNQQSLAPPAGHCHGGIRGLAIGNFDRTSGGHPPTVPSSLQIAVLQAYNLGSEVGGAICKGEPNIHIHPYWVDPSNWALEGPMSGPSTFRPQVPGRQPTFSMVTGDFQGGSLWVGPPEVVPLHDLAQLEVVLQAPPMHMDFIQPVDETSADLLNLSFGLPGFNTKFTESSGTTTSTSHQSTTSHSFAEKESLDDSLSFGIPDIASVSVDLKTSSEQTQKEVVSKGSKTITSTLDSMTTASDLDDRLWYSMHDVNLYIYPVLCPPDPKNPEKCGTTPSDLMFSVPQSQEVYSFVPGAAVEWYQPPHQVAQALSYPWTKAQLENLFPTATLDTKLEAQNLPAAGPLNTTFKWTGVGETTKSIGKTRTLSFDTSVSISTDANAEIDIFSVGGKTKESFSFNTSSSTSTLNTSETKIEGSIGFATNVPAASDVRSGSNPDYAYDFDVMVFGQKHPPCTSSSTSAQETTADADEVSSDTTCVFDNRTLTEEVTTQGTLWAGYTINLSDGGDWWTSPNTDYFTKHDIALGHPQRWVRDTSQTTGDNCLIDSSSSTELCYVKSPASLQPNDIWTSNFYQMKGFFVLPAVKNADGHFLAPQGPQTTVISADGQVWLQARIHNYSFVATDKNGDGTTTDNTVHVRFYAQEWDHVNHVPLAGKPSVLVDEVVLDGQCIPGHSSDSITKAACPNGGTNNWVLATTSKPFDPAAAGIDPGKSGIYVLFWVVAWLEDSSGALVPEVAEHGLTGLPGNLTSLTGASRLAETYSNNIGFFRLPTFVCPSGLDCSNVSVSAEQNASASNGPSSASSGELLLAATAGEPAASEPDVRIERLRLPKRATPLHEPLEVRALLSAGDVGPQGVHVALYDGDPEAGGQIFDVELIPYLRANDVYQIRTSFRPKTCGPHDIFVVADLGSGLEPVVGVATVNVSIDPASALRSLKDVVRSVRLPRDLRRSARRAVRAARRAFRHGEPWDGLKQIEDLRGHAWDLRVPVSVAESLQARVDAITECVWAANGEVAHRRQRPRYRWPF